MLIVDDELRKVRRIALPLPISIEMREEHARVRSEETMLKDVSINGAGFSLTRPVERGHLMLLTMPLPRNLRRYAFTEPQYAVWAVARRCIEIGKPNERPRFAIGTAFIGNKPPDDHLRRPK